jgi:hypothetical protein
MTTPDHRLGDPDDDHHHDHDHDHEPGSDPAGAQP